jgi:hypothetical protein
MLKLVDVAADNDQYRNSIFLSQEYFSILFASVRKRKWDSES